MHLHVSPELTTGNRRVLDLGLGQHIVEKLGAQRWRRSRGKTRAQAVLGIGGQGELRHQQQAAANILERQVHLALGIAEHPVVE
ncbi:hypothetical protein D3C79_874730 [compost metagenome]